MTFLKRILAVMVLVVIPAFVRAQSTVEDEPGWSFAQRFQGSSNAAGVVLKTTSTATYNFNHYIRAYAGVPVYFARQTSTNGSTSFMNGVGDVYSGFLVTAGGSILRYTSDLMATAPTGDTGRGFSTGHPTVDWTNTFSHPARFVTPYASIGAANTISDTSFFVRPFASKGIVGHYDAGALINVTTHFGIGGSAYGVRATGDQEIISKVVQVPSAQQAAPSQAATTASQPLQSGIVSTVNKVPGVANALGNSAGNSANRVPAVFETQQQTLGPAAVANDQGFSTWLTLHPGSTADFQVGYSRSNTYQLNSLFFGVGFHIGHYSVAK